MFTFHDFLNMRNAIDRTEFSEFLGKSIKKPKWLAYNPKDILNSLYDNFERFYNDGEIYLSCILRANSSMFRQLNGDRPAQMLYTNDDFFYEHPEELLKIVDNVFKFKNKNPSNDELEELKEILNGDFHRTFNFKIPYEFTENRDVWITSIMMFREHLPFHKISSFFYPLLVVKDETIGGMIVPKWYWSQTFRRYSNFICDNVVRPVTYKEVPPEARDFFEPFASLSFFKEHPLYYILFTILEVISYVTPFNIYFKICDYIRDSGNFQSIQIDNFNVSIGLIGVLLVGSGFVNIIWSFMDKYLGDVVTIKLFIFGILLMIISIIFMFL